MNIPASNDTETPQPSPINRESNSTENENRNQKFQDSRRFQNNRPLKNQRQPQDKSQKNHKNSLLKPPAALTTMPRNADTPPFRRQMRNDQNTAQESKKRPDGRTVRQPFNGQAHLYEVIQVRLARSQRLIEVNTAGIRLDANTPVLIRFHRNILLATTVGCRYRRVAEINALPFAVRIASKADLDIDAENAIFEKHAHELASEYALSQNLQMKVLSTDLSHDHKNVTINFASDVRVDFRDMVAYLAGKLKMRVEMFQLGVRNGTGLICGLGSCGQLLCCGRFLGQFDPVAVRQLRAQGLAANPKRISGVCGRLYCCMSYEYYDYTRDRKTLPKKGKRVLTRHGVGKVTDIDMLREDIVITYDNGEVQRMTPRDYVALTDEIAENVENGKIEFPLEPAKFYLNADPSAACETDANKNAHLTSGAAPAVHAPYKKFAPAPPKKTQPQPQQAQKIKPQDNAEKNERHTKPEKNTKPEKHPRPEKPSRPRNVVRTRPDQKTRPQSPAAPFNQTIAPTPERSADTAPRLPNVTASVQRTVPFKKTRPRPTPDDHTNAPVRTENNRTHRRLFTQPPANPQPPDPTTPTQKG